MPDNPKKRFLLPQARQAAIEARRRLAAKHLMGSPQIFVVRLAGARLFGWEIRKFGNIVLRRSGTEFESQLLAQAAGEEARAALMSA